MPVSWRTALCAPSHPAIQATGILRVAPVGSLSVTITWPGLLLDAGKLGTPLHRAPQSRSLSPMMRSLSSWPRIRMYGIRADAFPGFAQRHARDPSSLRPQIGTGAGLPSSSARSVMPSFGRSPGCGPARPALLSARRLAMAIDDHRAHAAPHQLIGKHQPGRTGPYNENVSVHVSSGRVGRPDQALCVAADGFNQKSRKARGHQARHAKRVEQIRACPVHKAPANVFTFAGFARQMDVIFVQVAITA